MSSYRPYQLTASLRRFSQRNTAFSRAQWDPTCLAYGRPSRSFDETMAEGEPDLVREGFAAHAAAQRVMGWIQQQSRPGSVMALQDGQAPPRHEPADWGEFTQRLKAVSRMFGACEVGVTRVNPLWVYACTAEEKPIELPTGTDVAVVLAVPMDHAMTAHSPQPLAAAATRVGYADMAFVGAMVALYLTELGWRAMPSGNDTALSIPLAVDAGLGEVGRNGMLITRRYGPRVRLCKVFTDAPLIPERPTQLGVPKACAGCRRCVEACPAGAIPDADMTEFGPSPSNNPGVLKWHVDPDKCLAFWRDNGTSCSNCIASCVFNRPDGRGIG